MSEVLEKARSSAFSGYLKVVLSVGLERSEGLVSFSAGAPVFCLYVYQPAGVEELWFMGGKAVEYTWYDTEQPEAIISLHGDVDLKDFEQLFPDARIKKLEAPVVRLSTEKAKAEKISSATPENTGTHMLGALGQNGDRDRKKVDQQARSVYDLILQYQKIQSTGIDTHTCKDCGGPVDLLGYCSRCASAEKKTPSQLRMDGWLTFDSFAAGSTSRFAEAAARAVAKEPGKLYNPLYIHSRSGLGKTHLLQAIGHQIQKDQPALSVVYIPLEAMDENQLNSLGDKQGELRQEMENSDVLLLDDLNFLSGKERLQEELLRIIKQLVASGKQVAMTADRSPRELPLMDDRIISAVESGLVVDIGMPDPATRLAILRKLVASEELKVPDDVLAFVAERCGDTVRNMESNMNRIIAFASLMRTDVTVDMVKEVMGEACAGKAKKMELAEHHSYVVEEARPERCYKLMLPKLDAGFRGIVFSRSNPASVRERLEGRKADIYWLTDHESKGEKTVPPSLEKIVLLAEAHMHQDGPSIVMLDDLHFLIDNATFDGVIRFVRSLVDQVSERPSIFMVSISPDSLRVQERSIIERELEPIK
jgi:chromosomal replication initiator protein DnaA